MYAGMPGIDAVCTECLDKATDAYNFIESCENSNERLSRILDSLTCTLSAEIDTTDKKVMYIVCNEYSSELILVDKELKPKKFPKVVPKVKCFVCKEVFFGTDEIKEHMLNEHRLYTCDKCQFTCDNETVMVEHEMSPELYKCAFLFSHKMYRG